MATQQLSATYKSPSATETFSYSLPSLPSGANAQNVKQKTTYLSALRSDIGRVQDRVNVFLTQEMEKDKASESSKASSKKKAQEAKEEEMYGEEGFEEDG